MQRSLIPDQSSHLPVTWKTCAGMVAISSGKLAASGRKRGCEEKGSGNQCHQYFLSQPKALLFSKESRLRAPPACLVCHHDTTTLLVCLASVSVLPHVSCSHDCPMLFPFH